jgi:hypothetical protein
VFPDKISTIWAMVGSVVQRVDAAGNAAAAVPATESKVKDNDIYIAFSKSR